MPVFHSYLEVALNSFIFLLLLEKISAINQCGGYESRYVCDIKDPRAFHICLGDNKFRMECPGVLNFNAIKQICDWPVPGLCPYDGFAGMEETLDDDIDNKADNNYVDDNDDINDYHFINSVNNYKKNIDVVNQEARPIVQPEQKSVPSQRVVNPYLRYKNRNKYNQFHGQSYSSIKREDTRETTKSSDEKQHQFESRPRSISYKSSRRIGKSRRRRLNPARGYRNAWTSAASSSQTHPTEFAPKSGYKRPNRVYSPFSPPLEIYSNRNKKKHLIDDDGGDNDNIGQINSDAAVNEHQKRLQEWLVNEIESNRILSDPGVIIRQENTQNNRNLEPMFVEEKEDTNLQQEFKKVPQVWFSKYLVRSSDYKGIEKPEIVPRSSFYKSYGNKESEILNDIVMKNQNGNANYRYSQKQNAMNDVWPSSPKKLSSRSNQKPVENHVLRQYYMDELAASFPRKHEEKRKNNDKARSERVYHSSNLNQRIYPYRPSQSKPSKPTVSSFKNKFELVNKKHGYKPNRIASYIDSVANKYSEKPSKFSF